MTMDDFSHNYGTDQFEHAWKQALLYHYIEVKDLYEALKGSITNYLHVSCPLQTQVMLNI